MRHVCDIIHANTAGVLGTYENDFYAGMPSVTVNTYGKGRAYYAAFRSDGELSEDLCARLIEEAGLCSDCPFTLPKGTFAQKRGDYLFLLNFADTAAAVTADKTYTDVITGEEVTGEFTVPARKYRVLDIGK